MSAMLVYYSPNAGNVGNVGKGGGWEVGTSVTTSVTETIPSFLVFTDVGKVDHLPMVSMSVTSVRRCFCGRPDLRHLPLTDVGNLPS